MSEEAVAYLHETTDSPVLIKGVLDPRDARLAVDGADGVREVLANFPSCRASVDEIGRDAARHASDLA